MEPERWHRVENLYHGALEVAERDRAAFLETSCAGDESLRREVESLLAHDAAAENFIESPALEVIGRRLARDLAATDPPMGGDSSRSGVSELPDDARPVIGARFGPYELAELIGEGGMGSVYRATDTRLGRGVAIKIVHRRFNARFEREARLISSLNHPHICTLYDVGPNYLVLELISGDSLGERLQRGALSAEQTIQYGIQIADALSAAHARGIIHRDLKPANIMISKIGIKVLDFGIARSIEDETLTAPKMVAGTPAYMAPEQRRAGATVDVRTDIYALGLVLYEMALGERPPHYPPSPVHGVPRELAHIIDRCLASDPNDRWQTASDIRAELKWAGTPQRVEKTPSPRRRWPWFLAGVCALIITIVVSIWMAPRRQVAVSSAQFPFTMSEAGDQMPVLSPDGRYLAFAGEDEKGNQWLFARALNASRSRSLPGTENASTPMWSPDSQWVAFFAAGRLKKVRPDGGPVQTIADLPGFQEGSWGSNGDILFRPSNREPLYLLRASGGAPTKITRLDVSLSENSHRNPQFLPDGRRFLFLARCAKRENNALYLGSIDSPTRKRVMRMDANVLYLPPSRSGGGRLLYYNNGALLVQPFDTNAMQPLGEPKIVDDQIAFNAPSTLAFFSASRDGRWLLVRPPGATYTHLQWFDRQGQLLETLPIEGELSQPRLSPDGDHLVFSRPDAHDGNRDLWLAEFARGIVSPLTTDSANDWFDAWSPDGKQILFASDRNFSVKMASYLKKSMDPGAEEYPTALPEDPYDWSADGNWMAFGTDDILVASAKDFHSFPYLATRFHESGARFSPDTKWLAYSSDESGRSEIYIRPFNGKPAGPGKIQISANGGEFPVWRHDGRELFFLSSSNFIYGVDLSNLVITQTIRAPVKLFKACPQSAPPGIPGSHAPYFYTFDTRDGNRFLVDCRVSAPGQFVVLLDSMVN